MPNIPTRNNNPGDLKDPKTGTFRNFSDPNQGFVALQNDLKGKMTGATSTGLKPTSSLVDFANVWAPASDKNDPTQYAAKLSKQLGVAPTTPIGSLINRVGDFAKAIAANEGWQGDIAHADTLPTSPNISQSSQNSLAAKVKAKYPQYNDIPDAELEQKIIAKYPQYSDMSSGNTQTNPSSQSNQQSPTMPQRGVPITPLEIPDDTSQNQNQIPVGSAGQSLGISDPTKTLTNAATGLTNALGLHGAVSNIGQNLAGPLNALDPSKSLDQKIAESKDLPPASLSQDLGAGLQIGAATAGFSAAPTTLLGNAATFGGLGAAQAGGASLASGQNLMTAAQKGFYGGLAGAALGSAGYGLQKGLTAITNKAPEALMNDALNISSKVKAADKSPADFMLNKGIWGSLGSMSRQVQDGMATENASIATKIADASGALDFTSDVQDPALKALTQKYGNLYSKAELQGLIDNVPVAGLKDVDTIDWATANKTRQQLGQLIGDSKWLQTNPTQSTSAAQAVYRALSSAIKENTGTSEEFSNLSNYIEANKAIGNALMAADKKWVPGFYDWTSGAVGSAIGMFGGSPVTGGLMGVAAQRALRSPLTQAAVAQGINAIPQVGGVLGRAAATSVASGLIGNGPPSPQTDSISTPPGIPPQPPQPVSLANPSTNGGIAPSQSQAAAVQGANPLPQVGGILGRAASNYGQQVTGSYNASIQQGVEGVNQILEGGPLKGLLGGLKVEAGIVGAAASPLAPVSSLIGKAIQFTGKKLADQPFFQKYAATAPDSDIQVLTALQNLGTVAMGILGTKGTDSSPADLPASKIEEIAQEPEIIKAVNQVVDAQGSSPEAGFVKNPFTSGEHGSLQQTIQDHIESTRQILSDLSMKDELPKLGGEPALNQRLIVNVVDSLKAAGDEKTAISIAKLPTNVSIERTINSIQHLTQEPVDIMGTPTIDLTHSPKAMGVAPSTSPSTSMANNPQAGFINPGQMASDISKSGLSKASLAASIVTTPQDYTQTKNGDKIYKPGTERPLVANVFPVSKYKTPDGRKLDVVNGNLVFFQHDPQWQISKNGTDCDPTAMATIISNQLGKVVTPDEVAKKAQAAGAYGKFKEDAQGNPIVVDKYKFIPDPNGTGSYRGNKIVMNTTVPQQYGLEARLMPSIRQAEIYARAHPGTSFFLGQRGIVPQGDINASQPELGQLSTGKGFSAGDHNVALEWNADKGSWQALDPNDQYLLPSNTGNAMADMQKEWSSEELTANLDHPYIVAINNPKGRPQAPWNKSTSTTSKPMAVNLNLPRAQLLHV